MSRCLCDFSRLASSLLLSLDSLLCVDKEEEEEEDGGCDVEEGNMMEAASPGRITFNGVVLLAFGEEDGLSAAAALRG